MHLFVFSFCLRRVGRGIAGLGIAGRCGFVAATAAAMPAAVIVRALFAARRSALGRLSRRRLRAAALRMLTCRFIPGLARAGFAVRLGLLALLSALRPRSHLLRAPLRRAPPSGRSARRQASSRRDRGSGGAGAFFFSPRFGRSCTLRLLVAVDLIRKQLRQRPGILLRLLVPHRLRPVLEQATAAVRPASGGHRESQRSRRPDSF